MRKSQGNRIIQWAGIRVLPFEFFYDGFAQTPSRITLKGNYSNQQIPLQFRCNLKFLRYNQFIRKDFIQIDSKISDKSYFAALFTQPYLYKLYYLHSIESKSQNNYNSYFSSQFHTEDKKRLIGGIKYFTKRNYLDYNLSIQTQNNQWSLKNQLYGFYIRQKFYLAFLGYYSRKNINNNYSILGYKVNPKTVILLTQYLDFFKKDHTTALGFTLNIDTNIRIGGKLTVYNHKSEDMSQTFLVVQRYFNDNKNFFKAKIDKDTNLTLSLKVPLKIGQWYLRVTPSILLNKLSTYKQFLHRRPSINYSLMIDII